MKTITGLFKFVCLVCCLIVATKGEARPRGKGSWVHFLTQYSVFEDISLSESETTIIEPVLDFEVGFRFYSIFSILMVSSSSVKFEEADKRRRAYGVGMRVDLPGFFFLGGKMRDLNRRGRDWPVNTNLFIHMLREVETSKNSESQATQITTKYGGNIDIYIFNPYTFLSVNFAIYSYAGNAFSSWGGGIGVEF